MTSGPYRWIRNPPYTAGTLIFVGLGLISASWFSRGQRRARARVGPAAPVTEEAELEARFGERYRGYARRTGRFLPRWPK